jgi:hypothetical protein
MLHRKKRSRIVDAVGAVSRERSSKVPGKIVRRGVVNGTLPKKKRSRIVDAGGAASRERSSKVPGKIVRRGVVNGTLPKKKRSSIASRAGAASTDPPERASSKLPRRIARRGAVSATLPNKKHATAVRDRRQRHHQVAGPALTERSFQRPKCPEAHVFREKRRSALVTEEVNAGSALTEGLSK